MIDAGSITCVILCGGKGSRMNSPTKHKVCFEIDGVPAIQRSLDSYKQVGIGKFVVVVGSMAGQVVECVGGHTPEAVFVYQPIPLGTGDAMRKAFNAVRRMSIPGPIMITMGDKLIEPDVINRVVETFANNNSDITFAVQPKSFNPSGGRVLVDDDDRVRGIYESIDVQAALVYDRIAAECENLGDGQVLPWDRIREYARTLISKSSVADQLLEQFSKHYETFGGRAATLRTYITEHNLNTIQCGDQTFPASAVEKAPYVNAALYLFNADMLGVLDRLSTQNAQGELYLTDAVNIIANTRDNGDYRYDVRIEPIEHEHDLMAYNNAEELLEIEDLFRTRRLQDQAAPAVSPDKLKTIDQWRELFTRNPASLREQFVTTYGDHKELIEDRRAAYLDVLQRFAQVYGSDRQVVISRAPGRVNLMGRHIEHRGGNVNVMSINKEIIAVASLRDDDVINITNTDTEFVDRTFRISDHLLSVGWNSWVSYLDSDEIRRMVYNSRGDWMNYVKAAVLRLQHQYQDRKLHGMDIAFSGNIPQAAGLSSSSAVLVSTAEAAVVLNGLDVSPQAFVDLCGQGEWFVGSRGGSGDHAAMKFGHQGYVAHLGFFPFGLRGVTPFPEGYSLLVANSFIQAKKSHSAKDRFNSRVASYEFSFMLLKQNYPQYAHLLQYLRDVNSDNLGVPPSKIYEMLLELPEYLEREHLFERIDHEYHDKVNTILTTHEPEVAYPIRSVLLYGIAECRRSQMFQQYLESGDMNTIGTLMGVSHDGDRVSGHDDKMRATDFDYSAGNEYMIRLINDLKSEHPQRVWRAQLEMQPGGYACSTTDIDYMVDLAIRVPGVVGAQMSGAGLGGCIMVLVESDHVRDVVHCLEEKYYHPRQLKDGITVCTPVAGSGVWSLNEE